MQFSPWYWWNAFVIKGTGIYCLFLKWILVRGKMEQIFKHSGKVKGQTIFLRTIHHFEISNTQSSRLTMSRSHRRNLLAAGRFNFTIVGVWEFLFSVDFLVFENFVVPKFQLFLFFSAYFWHFLPNFTLFFLVFCLWPLTPLYWQHYGIHHIIFLRLKIVTQHVLLGFWHIIDLRFYSFRTT